VIFHSYVSLPEGIKPGFSVATFEDWQDVQIPSETR
jgi:hypothetical protein